MTDTAMIEIVLHDIHSPGRGFGIWVQLFRGPAAGPDYELVDMGLDAPVVEKLLATSLGIRGTRVVGERLLAALRQNEAVKTALHDALEQAQCPISVLFAGKTKNGIALPWETLFDPTWPGFLELRGKTPTSRAVHTSQSSSAPAVLDRPRMLAVLSAPRPGGAQLPGPTDDWSYVELQQIMEAIKESGVTVDLRVLTSEPSVLKLATEQGLTAEKISDASAVVRTIANFGPHFLHFFCHGTDEPSPQLMLYKPADVHTGTPQLRIDADLLTRDVGYTCLIVLNSCSGAAAAEGTQSMAHELVSKRFPAVIGMREPVEWHDATKFTSALYRNMLHILKSRASDSLDLRIMAALEWPRRAILDKFGAVPDAAERHREWTLPVIYTRPGSTQIPVMSAEVDEPPEQQAWWEGQHLAENSVGTHLHPDTPTWARDLLTGLADELTLPRPTGEVALPEFTERRTLITTATSEAARAAAEQAAAEQAAAEAQTWTQDSAG
jgi:hypothetical protein